MWLSAPDLSCAEQCSYDYVFALDCPVVQVRVEPNEPTLRLKTGAIPFNRPLRPWARRVFRPTVLCAFVSLADVAKGGDGAKSALREILCVSWGFSLIHPAQRPEIIQWFINAAAAKTDNQSA